MIGKIREAWLRGVDLNHRPLGYEPNELPDCSTPQDHHSNVVWSGQTSAGFAYCLGKPYIRFVDPILFLMSLRTLNDVFLAVVERQNSNVMLQRLGDEWVPISSETLRERVLAVSGALREMGHCQGRPGCHPE